MRPQFSQRPRRLYGAELQPVTVLATLSLCTGTVCLRSWTLPSTMKLRMSDLSRQLWRRSKSEGRCEARAVIPGGRAAVCQGPGQGR